MSGFRAYLPVTSCLAVVSLLALCSGCGSGGDGEGEQEKFITLGTAPVGGAFAPVGNAIASELNSHKGDSNWKVQAKGTGGSQQNIRMLDKGELQLGMSNSAISYYAVNGKAGWDKKYKIRAVVTLAPNVGLFITKADQGISTIADLKGKRVAVGPSGAGFEMFLMPLMNDHGVTWEENQQDFTIVNANYSDAVGLLGDGNAEAAFMGGAIPLPAISQACTTMDVHFIPFDQAVVDNLVREYPFYEPVSIPAGTYPDVAGEFQALNVGSMQLITSADQPDELIYEITKTIWESRDAIAKQHPSAKAINPNNAARFTGTPFHPGAIKFYKEEGIWKDPATGGSE